MISVELRRASGRWLGFRIEGHAGYAESGFDIVCAAVTAVAETAVLGLTRVAGIRPTVIRRDGFLSCEIGEVAEPAAAQAAGVILDTMALGLGDIAVDYAEYVRVEDLK